MPVPTRKLKTVKNVLNQKKRGYHGAGDGLYMAVAKSGHRSWIFRYRFGSRRRDVGLGSVRGVTLADARRKAEALR